MQMLPSNSQFRFRQWDVRRSATAVGLILSCGLLLSCQPQTPTGVVPKSTTADRPSRIDTSSQAADPVPTPTSPSIAAQRFARPQSLASGAARFHELTPETTGVQFTNAWSPEQQRPPDLENSFIGSGVAIGDFDNDGLPDLFLTRRTGGARLYRNLGEFQFQDVTQQLGILFGDEWSTGATFVDIDNDGRLDLYVCNYDRPNRLLINRGDRFEESAKQYGLDFRGASVLMTFADYDLDGDLDGYLLTNRLVPPSLEGFQLVRGRDGPVVPERFREFFEVIRRPDGVFDVRPAAQFDHFYRNDGGHFVEATLESGMRHVPYHGLSATWWDYNNDRYPDLYVANDFMGAEHLYRNNGPDAQGRVTFTDVVAEALPHTPWFSMGSDVGDLNNDGKLDYMASDMAGTNHYRDKLSMGGMSGPDSRAWFLNYPNPPQYMRNAVYLNTGTPRFMEVAFLLGLAKTDWTWTVRLCDLDNDGWQDVFCTNGMSRDWFNGDLIDRAKMIAKQRSPDARDEFWSEQPKFALENLAFRNTGGLKFDNVGHAWGLDHLGVSTGAASGDLDGDGDLDLVVNGFDEPAKIYRNDVATGNAIRVRLRGTESNSGGIGAKVTLEVGDASGIQTRYLNTNQGFMSGSEPLAHFGTGASETASRLTVTWPSGKTQTFKNLESNHLYEVVEADGGADPPTKREPTMFLENQNALVDQYQHVELDYDDFQAQPLLPNKYSQLGPGMCWGDIDGDGDQDVFVGNGTLAEGVILLNLGQGKFQLSRQTCFKSDAISEDMGCVFFDADQDNDLDLFVVSGGVEQKTGARPMRDRLYLNDGQGKFTAAPEDSLPDNRNSGGVVAAADMNRDGKIDLFIGGRIVPGKYPTAPVSSLLINQGGDFVDETQSRCPEIVSAGMVTSAVWSDVDSDGWVDLLVTYEWGSVRLFLNREGFLRDATESSGLSQRAGWYNSICSGDVDNDGDVDFVVGNFGLNSKYYASNEKPELLYYGDFEGDGRKHIVEAKFEQETCFPRRGLGCTSHAMPSIKSKLPTYHEFALSDLSGIYSDNRLESAQRFAANHLASAAIINHTRDGNVKFEFIDLPRLAQASPIYGCVFNDFDGDRILDLVVAQNFFGPQRETGYLDGGVSLFLRGSGDGHFESVWPDRSGLVVPGDAKSLTLADLNGDQQADLVFGINANRPLCFNSQFAGTLARSIRLVGPQGNPTAIGTRLRLIWDDQVEQLYEVTAGSGYLSQSTMQVFLASGKRIEKIIVNWPDGQAHTLNSPQFESGVLVIRSDTDSLSSEPR